MTVLVSVEYACMGIPRSGFGDGIGSLCGLACTVPKTGRIKEILFADSGPSNNLMTNE
jgi:hypothetical protein